MSTKNFPRMHVSYYVSDLEKTVAFYNTLFGKEPEKIERGYTKYILEQPALIISFIENPDKVQPQFGHLGFELETQAELFEKLEWAKNLDLVAKEEIETSCCYAIQDKFWVHDPDGYEWEMYYFHRDVSFTDPHESAGEKAECCIPKQTVELQDLNS